MVVEIIGWCPSTIDKSNTSKKTSHNIIERALTPLEENVYGPHSGKALAQA